MTNYLQAKPNGLSQTNYGTLMQRRIRKIMLICSSYDAYTLEEDGRIEVQIHKEYIDLNIINPPSFKWVSSSLEAKDILLADNDFDLVISMLNVGELDVFSFAKQIKEVRPELPLVLLTNFSKGIKSCLEKEDQSGLDYIFSWN